MTLTFGPAPDIWGLVCFERASAMLREIRRAFTPVPE